MMYREIIVVCPQIHTKHINTWYWQSVGFFFMLDLVVHTVTIRLYTVSAEMKQKIRLTPGTIHFSHSHRTAEPFCVAQVARGKHTRPLGSLTATAPCYTSPQTWPQCEQLICPPLLSQHMAFP